ncbi:P-loop NTPase fold protein [Simplicispira suum]|nr:P-loop NTPase fold protein [Simplicispira suum]
MSEVQVDQGHKVLKELIDAYGKLQLSDSNEAETRFKVIDGMLEDVLGWQRDDLSLEPPCSEFGHTEFADYHVKTATTSLIVEAKKAGATFTLPNNLKSGKLGGFLSSGAIGEAIRQARQYCQTKSAPFAVVTNGDAWIVFPAVRTDGIEFNDTQARIFRSLKDIECRFVEFWELLSRQRVIEGNLEKELLQADRDVPIRRALTLLRDPDARLGRNTLYQHLSPAVDKVLTDQGLLNDADALNFCYVRNAERTGFDSRLRMYLTDPKPQLGIPATRIRTSKKSHDYFDQKINQSSVHQSKFFLILGSVGAGKSTFLAFTRFVSSREIIESKIGWLYLDFKKATEHDSPRDFIYSQLLNLIESDSEFGMGDWEATIYPAYKSEVENLSRGPLFMLKKSDPAAFDKEVSSVIMNERKAVIPYVDRIVSYIDKQRPVFVTIDNVDQIENDQRQNEIFAEAQAFSQKHKVNIIIALRDTTYRKYRTSPTFDAFELEAVYIDAPSVIPVLSRRFAYARKMLENQKAELQLESGARFKVEDIGAFFEIAAQSLLSVDGAELLDTLAGGNIRRGLSLAREFLASGHVTADLALQKYLTDRAWRFPPHEVFKGAVLGGRKFFREEDSLLPNMYCAKIGIPSLQLLRVSITDFLVHLAQSSNFDGLIVEELQGTLHQVGIAQREVDFALKTLLDSSILRTLDGEPLNQSSRLIPTRLAGFLVQDLMGRFNYTEMCALDAHIYDNDLWGEIRDLTYRVQMEPGRAAKLQIRIQRVNAFLTYLEEVEERWLIEAKRRNLGQGWLNAPIKNRLRPLVHADCERALASANFQQSKAKR